MHPRQSVHPLGRARVDFFQEIWEICTVGVVNLVVLACVLRATTKKGLQLFPGRKVHPRENPGYAYGEKHCMIWAIGGLGHCCLNSPEII